jgi:hypothetical protein
MGILNAWFIAGGLADWHDEVLAPVLARDADPALAELSRYFGGVPTLGEGVASDIKTARSRRRGC